MSEVKEEFSVEHYRRIAYLEDVLRTENGFLTMEEAENVKYVFSDGKQGYVYTANFSDGSVKIGVTKNPKRRMREISRRGREMEDCSFYISDDAYNTESLLLGLNIENLIKGEYFSKLNQETIDLLSFLASDVTVLEMIRNISKTDTMGRVNITCKKCNKKTIISIVLCDDEAEKLKEIAKLNERSARKQARLFVVECLKEKEEVNHE